MDVSYSSSSLQGYKLHLYSREVTLPLKYSPVPKAATPNDLFHRKLATSGDVIELDNSLINAVAYEVLGDLRTVTITPINTGPNNLSLNFQSLKFLLPHPLISTSCINVQYDKDNGDEGAIIIDIIDTDHLFITFKIELSDFIKTKSNRLTISNFSQWGNISVPYSFELRSSPYLLKSLDSLNLVVSLKDGGLLHFQRSTVLSDFDVFNFNEAPALLPLNFISGLFKKNAQLEVVLEGISSNSVVDAIALGKDNFVTLSVSKVLKVWSLKDHIPVLNPIFINQKIDTESWLTTVPTRHLLIYTDGAKEYLTLHVSINSTDSNLDKSGFQFKTWEVLDSTSLSEISSLSFEPELPNILLVTLSSSKQEADFRNRLWFIQDYRTQNHGDFVKYHILWKSNTSSVLVVYACNIQTGAVVSINWSHINNHELVETAPHQEISHYANDILNCGKYDDLIVRTSLNVLRENLGAESIGSKPIRTEIDETLLIWTNSFGDSVGQDPELSTMVDYSISELDPSSNGDSSKSFWFKLYSLCAEYKKLSEETLAIGILSQASLLLSLESNGLGIFRPSHFYESFLYKKRNSPEGKLAGILSRFPSLLSTKSNQKLYKFIKQSVSLTTEQTNDIFDTYLRPKIPNEIIEEILLEVESIPMDVINSLIDSLNEFEMIDIDRMDDGLELGSLNKLNTIETFREIKGAHENLLFNLLILILLCEGEDQTTFLINKILTKLNAYDVLELIIDTSFKSLEVTSPIENSGLSNVENSLFWSSIVSRHHSLKDLIVKSRLNEAFDYLHGRVLSNYDNFITDVAIELIDRNEGSFIRKKFFDKLNVSRSIDKFLIGLVYLIDNEAKYFFEAFEEYNILDQRDQIDKIRNELSSNEPIKNFLDSIFDENLSGDLRKAQYYHSLSELAKLQASTAQKSRHSLILTDDKAALTIVDDSNSVVPTKTTSAFLDVEVSFNQTALKFEQKAIEILKSTEATDSTTSLITQYYLNVFELAMALTDYDLIYESLLNLDTSYNDSDSYKELFTRFLKKLIFNHSIAIIFPPNKNTLYQKKYILIDSVLLQLANDELALSKSLRYYEYLYSWRLFGASNELGSDQLADKRGAIEALYLFITRFRFEHSHLLQSEPSTDDVKQYKLKILELYMIILNCLRSFKDDEDKWILKSKDSNHLKIIRLDELKIEYYDWLKELEGDLRED
ncbi:uncharacterized protein CANTADRAFT_24549 [Suhomyces tanzawaensis NRRL Y-17324]|uniref:Nucleoporin Nup120/160 beta-propeller domain-containing protein n=1 Tax=Suhomyces tanzawaensis NRRL Y-17324 TaxID=984487 RepID=A0A1E4SQC9_9ASCO|nr:uncharacterized protein CANTADRAFT_24549 [Suhomyces tanzawaensis NRRL Y-17324]ODV81711.1 hypothetical protein CANTADRAFT_24549 [Suhomyces tanzawaensis NRRL Y-17324]